MHQITRKTGFYDFCDSLILSWFLSRALSNFKKVGLMLFLAEVKVALQFWSTILIIRHLITQEISCCLFGTVYYRDIACVSSASSNRAFRSPISFRFGCTSLWFFEFLPQMLLLASSLEAFWLWRCLLPVPRRL